MSGIAGNAKQRSFNAPGHDHPVGHKFVADRLADGFHQIQEFVFLARIDGVLVPESERLHWRLRLLCGTGNTRQQKCKKTQNEARFHCWCSPESLFCLWLTEYCESLDTKSRRLVSLLWMARTDWKVRIL